MYALENPQIWIGLYLFETVLAPYLGIRLLHIQISGSVATIAISFLLISTIRNLLRWSKTMISPQLTAIISSFVVILVSLIAIIVLMYQWGINPQTIFVGGGVIAVIVGIALSSIVGNILSCSLVLTNYLSSQDPRHSYHSKR